MTSTAVAEQVDHEQQNDGAGEGDEEAADVKTGNSGTSEHVHQPSANEGTQDTDNDITNGALFGVAAHDH